MIEGSGGEPTRVDGVDTPMDAPSGAEPPPPHYGRYVVIAVLGRGGMGEVVHAYDPKLHREVALKRLHASTMNDDATSRLIREAQAMAQLTHPNVVGVYDVDVESRVVVIAMEYVPGQTLRGWLEHQHAWPRLLATFEQAGQGLQAAHDAGLVHRDFKPDNVLVPEDGRVKVTDFGLARAEGGAGGTALDGSPLDSQLTAAGSVMGTPRYMAPEQHMGQTVGPLADQYSFCATLWEGLCGAPPFQAGTLRDLAFEKTEGPPAWPDDVSVPRPIVQAIRRGLQSDPESRWPSMNDLLAALRFDPGRRRRRWAMGAGAVSIGAMLVLGALHEPPPPPSPCVGAADELAGVWDEPIRERIASAFSEVPVGHAASTWTRVHSQLDAYAQTWADQQLDACEATLVRHEKSASVMALRMRCLERAQGDLSAVTELLGRTDATLVDKADKLVAGLHPLSRCDDEQALLAEVPPPDDPEVEARVDALRTVLSRVSASMAAAEYEDAMAMLEPVVTEAETLGYPPLIADAGIKRGELLDGLARYDEANAALSEALDLSLRHGMQRQAARAAAFLAYVTGYRESKIGEAERLMQVALGLAEHVEDPGLESDVRNNLATVLYHAARYDEAEQQFRHVIALHREASPDDDRGVAVTHSNLGATLERQGRYAESIESYEIALEIQRRTRGLDHPGLAGTLDNLGNVLRAIDRFDEALGHHRRALQLRQSARGPDHPDVALSHNNLGSAFNNVGRYEEAEAEHRKALETRLTTLGPDHPDTALSHHNLGLTLGSQKRYADAREYYDEALEVWTRVLGPRHPNVAMARHNLAGMLREQGQYDDARAQHLLSIEIWSETVGKEHPYIGTATHTLGLTNLAQGQLEDALENFREAARIREARLGADSTATIDSWAFQGRVLSRLGRNDEARPWLERAWAAIQSHDDADDHQRRAAFWLAVVLWDDPSRRAEAVELAARAHALEGTDDDVPWLREQLDAWVTAHRT